MRHYSECLLSVYSGRRATLEMKAFVFDLNIATNFDPNIDPNIGPNIDPKIDPNIDPNIYSNIDPNIAQILNQI